jgi:hypothetical protein
MKSWSWPSKTTPASRRRFANIFGHLMVQYTRTKMRSWFTDSAPDSCDYKVVASDLNSAAIVCGTKLYERKIYQINFEGENSYWISLDAGYVEWFKRVK